MYASKYSTISYENIFLLFINLSSSTDSAFKQQRLPAWQPVLTAGTVLPAFFVIGIAFIPVGVALLYFSNAVSSQIILCPIDLLF